MNIEPLLIDLDAVRTLLGGVSRSTVWRLTKDEALPVVRLRDRVLFPVEAIRNWIEARTSTGEAA